MKNLLTILIFIAITNSVFAQKKINKEEFKKPTLMILPSDNWCNQRYYMTTFDNNGTKIKVPNYQQAFQEDTELSATISNIGQILTDLGYSIKDAELELKNINNRTQENNVTTSSSSNSYLSETPLDILKRKIKSDILIQIWWTVNKEDTGKSVSFTLEAFDSYTSKRIATYNGISIVSKDIVPRILQNTIKESITTFDKQIMSYYRDMEKRGREIIFTVKCWENWKGNLETEYDSKELIEFINIWMQQNTVEKQFNLSNSTATTAQFEQVRIPLFDENKNPIDARMFGVEFQKYLKQQPFQLISKVSTRGLGEVIIIIGEK